MRTMNFLMYTRSEALQELAMPESSSDLELWDELCAVHGNDAASDDLVMLVSPDMHQFVLEQIEFLKSLD